MITPKRPQSLTRAQFIKVAAGVAVGAVGAYALYEMAPWLDPASRAKGVRGALLIGGTGNQESRELVRYATLAASGHNTQPWRFLVSLRRIEIRPDLLRRLPAVDPDDRELWISLGCALENMTLAARKVGLQSEITYPGSNDFIGVEFALGREESGGLFDAIPGRQNTRSAFDGRAIPAGDVSELDGISSEPGISVRFLQGQNQIEKTLEYVRAGDLDQFGDPAFMRELTHWVRFDKRDAMASLDGLYSACTGNSLVPRWLGSLFLNRMAPKDQADLDAKLLRSSAGAVAIASDSDDRAAWVRTGQVYQRLALKMTSMGIKTAFLNQPIEVPGLRGQFQSALGFGSALPQLLMRVGYADPMPFSMRRSVDDVIDWASG